MYPEDVALINVPYNQLTRKVHLLFRNVRSVVVAYESQHPSYTRSLLSSLRRNIFDIEKLAIPSRL